MPVTGRLYRRIREDEDAVIDVIPNNQSSPALRSTGSFTVSSLSNMSELQLSLYENLYITVSGVADIRAVILLIRNYCLPHLRSLNFILTSLVTTSLFVFTDLYVYNCYPLLTKITFMIKKENPSSPKGMVLTTTSVTKEEKTELQVGNISVLVSEQHTVSEQSGLQSVTLSFSVKTKDILANIPKTSNRIVYHGQVFIMQIELSKLNSMKEKIKKVVFFNIIYL